MKELGEYLKNARVENGVSIDEVSEDLQIDSNAIENIESGNIRAFKDMYVLKDLVRDYAKYLGLDINYVVDEFNDFLFCHTSKISIDEIKDSNLEQNVEEEKKITSPYTVIPKEKKDYSKVIKIIAGVILFIILLFIIINLVTKKKGVTQELKGVDSYEFTNKINCI